MRKWSHNTEPQPPSSGTVRRGSLGNVSSHKKRADRKAALSFHAALPSGKGAVAMLEFLARTAGAGGIAGDALEQLGIDGGQAVAAGDIVAFRIVLTGGRIDMCRGQPAHVRRLGLRGGSWRIWISIWL